MRVICLLGVPQGLKALLAVDHLAALIIIKLLKIHGFNTYGRFRSSLLKLYLASKVKGFNSSGRILPKLLKLGAFGYLRGPLMPPWN
jgi:hypothetical protein